MAKPAFFTCALFAAAAAGGCSQAALPASDAAAIVAAADDCTQATSVSGVEVDILTSLGWQRGSTVADGQEIDPGLAIFGKSDGGPLILTGRPGAPSNNICIITGELAQTDDFDSLLGAMTRHFGTGATSDGDHQFRAGADRIMISKPPAGSRSIRAIIVETGAAS